MANFANLKVYFNSSVFINEKITFTTTGGNNFQENAVITRSSPNNMAVVAVSSNAEAAYNATLAFQADYGSVITVKSWGGGRNYIELELLNYIDTISNISVPAGCTYDYLAPVEPVPDFEITAITPTTSTIDPNFKSGFFVDYINGTRPCTITSPVSTGQNPTDGLFIFETARYSQTARTVTLIDADSKQASFTPMPNVDYFTFDNVTVVTSVSGATVSGVITLMEGDVNTIREFSLDQVSWQTSSVFQGILPGNYTMYLRDNLNFSDSKDFTVEQTEKEEPPYAKIEKANGIRYVPVVDYDCNTIANWDNALFSQLFEHGKFTNVAQQGYTQLVSDCDIIPTQIQTTYDNVTAKLFDCEGNDIFDFATSLHVENLDKKDKRDAVIGGSLDGKVVVYFLGGNIYTPDTLDTIGSYSNFGGALPDFYNGLKEITLSGYSVINGTFKVIGEYYDNTNQRNGVLLEASYDNTESGQGGQAQSLYNAKDYNIWGFDFVGSVIDNSNYYIEVYFQDDDPNYPDFTWRSEPITNDGSKTVLLESSNSDGAAGIDFTTGFKTTLRVPARYIKANNTEESTDFTSDTGRRSTLKVIIQRVLTLESSFVPFYLAEKIAIASSFNNIEINKVSYARGESYEVEDRLSERNPFVIVNRDYVSNDTINVGGTGIATTTSQVIGDGNNVVIGDNE